jgi:hypothetical protein
MLHKNFAIVTRALVNKLTRVKGEGETYGLIDQADASAYLRKRWYDASNREKERWIRAWERGRGAEPPTLGGWRSIKFKFDEPPHDLINIPCIIRICTEKPRKPHPTLGEVPRWVVYIDRMTGPADRVVRLVDVWRNEEDCLFELPYEKGQYGRFFWSHRLSLFTGYGERQLPRLVIYHPVLEDLRPDGWSDTEETIEEAAREEGLEL